MQKRKFNNSKHDKRINEFREKLKDRKEFVILKAERLMANPVYLNGSNRFENRMDIVITIISMRLSVIDYLLELLDRADFDLDQKSMRYKTIMKIVEECLSDDAQFYDDFKEFLRNMSR